MKLKAGNVQIDVTASAMPGHILMGVEGEVYVLTPEEASELAHAFVNASNKCREIQAKRVLKGDPPTVLP